MNFRDWVEKMGGPAAVGKLLGRKPKAVEHWLAGRNHPRLPEAHRILKLAKGELTLDDILKSETVGRWPKEGK